MSKAAYKKRQANLLYRLRREGVKCNTKLRLIFIPFLHNPYQHSQVMKLCKEYHFNIQYTIP